MGMTHADRAKRDAEIQALVDDQAADDTNQVETQVITTEDATIGNEERLRGIPAVGRVSGTIRGTSPGDSAAELERAGRDIVRAKMNRHRFKRPKQVE